jgi:PadR family transcriptional regulator PadR
MGDVAPFRLTIETLRILRVFLDSPREGQYGLELADAAGLPSGSIYPILARLETAGWIEGFWEQIDPVREGRRPRRYYKLTAVGHPAAVDAVREVNAFFSPGERAAWAKS